MKTIGVIGSGTMGSGIAQIFACNGFDVILQGTSNISLQKGIALISNSLDRLIKKNAITAEEKIQILDRVFPTSNISDLAESDFIIEAAPENESVKIGIFQCIEQVLPPDTIIATNTSSLSITKLAAATKRPEKMVGMHFFNPVPIMSLVEIVQGFSTSEKTLETVTEIAKAVGKIPIVVKNSPGFVVNRLLCPMINEAIFIHSEGLATAAEIDNAMKLGCNHPIGPLALADLVGLDILLAVMDALYQSFEDPKYRASPLLREMVHAGHLGRKTGRGFYRY